jgi:2-keto-4-pentenoate hydratase/2-oxohepta-3-ene-1,7-dioic acid hydratase in catechol pathway
MKLAMINADGSAHPAVVCDNGEYVDLRAAGLPWDSLEQLIEAGEAAWREAANAANHSKPRLQNPVLLAPLSRPQKIMCIGRNYADHAKELGHDLPKRPVLFAKYANALAGPGAEIPLPSVSEQIDFEAELAVVIGKSCKDVKQADALDHVFGYTCANDITMRDAQKSDGQWTRAKSPDSFCPVGPWIVTADEIDNPQALDISMALNGKVMQDSNTKNMVFGVAELISYLSKTMTLLPGDLLLTGTPPGVGAGRDPQVFIKNGDTLKVTIGCVGELNNTAG